MDKCKKIMQYFPEKIKNILNVIKDNEWSCINEINIINGQAMLIKIKGKLCFAGNKGLTHNINDAYRVDKYDIKKIYELITNSSSYAYNRFINEGFLTLSGGHRVGLIGNCVVDDNKIVSVNHINSFCFRITHDNTGNAGLIVDDIYNNGKILNTVIISPPGCGKTTFIRNLASIFGSTKKDYAILKCGIIDERFEIAACFNGIPTLDVGCSSVIISGCSKNVAIPIVVRSMSPDILIADELASSDDITAIKYAYASGCKVIATTHGYDENNNELSNYNIKNFFDLLIVLDSSNGPGTITKIIRGDTIDT